MGWRPQDLVARAIGSHQSDMQPGLPIEIFKPWLPILESRLCGDSRDWGSPSTSRDLSRHVSGGATTGPPLPRIAIFGLSFSNFGPSLSLTVALSVNASSRPSVRERRFQSSDWTICSTLHSQVGRLSICPRPFLPTCPLSSSFARFGNRRSHLLSQVTKLLLEQEMEGDNTLASRLLTDCRMV